MINPKKLAAEKALDFVKNGMTIGLGTGSTAYWAIQLIGERVRQGLDLKAVPTSLSTEKLAKELHIPLAALSDLEHIDLSIDGADEIDHAKNLIKGGGGALLREKIVSRNSREFIVIADESKLVNTLGKFPLPLEILPFCSSLTLRLVSNLCKAANIRRTDGEIFLTDNGNYIIDCEFAVIHDAGFVNSQLKLIPGVLETGLFLKETVSKVVIGYNNGEIRKF
jgi:ribose 5-phosphate isomerase A